jgi:integrase
MIELFRQYKRKQLEQKLLSGGDWIETGHVFTTKFGRPIDNGNDRKAWDRLLKAAGVRGIKLHAARHTAATMLLGRGTDIVVVSKLLGHSNIQTTVEYYAHVSKDSKLQAIENLGQDLLKIN